MDESKYQLEIFTQQFDRFSLTFGKNFNQIFPSNVVNRPIKWFVSFSVYAVLTFSLIKWNGDGILFSLFLTTRKKKTIYDHWKQNLHWSNADTTNVSSTSFGKASFQLNKYSIWWIILAIIWIDVWDCSFDNLIV